jgi:hypothetical protein
MLLEPPNFDAAPAPAFFEKTTANSWQNIFQVTFYTKKFSYLQNLLIYGNCIASTVIQYNNFLCMSCPYSLCRDIFLAKQFPTEASLIVQKPVIFVS